MARGRCWIFNNGFIAVRRGEEGLLRRVSHSQGKMVGLLNFRIGWTNGVCCGFMYVVGEGVGRQVIHPHHAMETCSNGHDDSWGTTLSRHPRDLAGGVQNGFITLRGRSLECMLGSHLCLEDNMDPKIINWCCYELRYQGSLVLALSSLQ